MERLREIDEDCAGIALVLEWPAAEEDLVDVKRVDQVELDPRVILEHFEPDRVLPADELFLRIDANVEVVEQQVVVGAIWPVSTAQDVSSGRLTMVARPRRGG